MKLTWLGHACFLLEQDGYTLLVDPYTGVDGYPPLSERRLTVNKVLCSHGHHDHNAVDQVTVLPEEAPCPFAVRTVETFHDEERGALRGTSTVHILSAGSVTVAHMGDLGHRLPPEQIEAVGALDVMLIPVGGYYTINAKAAKAVCDALAPKCVIPMHYRGASRGYPVLAEAEDFLALWPAGQVRRLDGPTLALTGGETGVIVPKFCEES